jgi:hypothetical protein
MAGALAMTVYLLTESLLAPILLHVTLDLVNGFTLYRVVRESSHTTSSCAAALPKDGSEYDRDRA